MNKCRLYISFVAILSCVYHSFAQHTFMGTVIDAETKEAIGGVDVFDQVSRAVKTSDQNGRFTFTNLSTGQHIFTTFSMEYETADHILEITKDLSTSFSINPLGIQLAPIDIAAKREELFAIKQLKDVEGTSIFAGKKTEVVLLDFIQGNVANNNSREVYAQVSGLNIYEGSDGGLQLNIGGRGLDPNRTSNFNTRQNGYDISADVLGYPENYYAPPTEGIEEIRIIRGASSLQYGTQFGGLIDFRMRTIPSFKKYEIKTNQTFGSFGSFNSFNAVGANFGNFRINTHYNYKRGNGYRPNSNYKAHNVFLNAAYKISNQTSLSGEFTYFNYLAKQAGGLTDQQFEIDPRQSTRARNWFAVDWKLYNLTLKHNFASNTNLTVSFFGLDASRNSLGYRGNPINSNENPITSLDEQDVEGNYISPRDLILGSFQNYGLEVRFLNQYQIKNKKAVLLLGAKYYKSNNSAIQGPGSLGTDANFSLQTNNFPDYPSQSNFIFPNLNYSFFGEHIFYINDKFSITPGFRLEYINTKSEGNYNQVIFDNAGNAINNRLIPETTTLPRTFGLFGVGLTYKQNDKLQYNFNLSQNYRSVTFSDIRVVSPTFIVDPNIQDEKGFTADFGIRGRINKFFSYDANVYSVLYNDRIGIILDDRANRVRKNIGDAIIIGTESLINLNVARLITPGERNYKFSLFLNTSFTYSEYLSSQENNVVGKKVEFIPTTNIKTGLSGGYKNLHTALQFSFLSDQFTDVQNSSIAVDGDNRSGIIGQIPSYQVLDFSLSYKFQNIKVEGGINNVLNRAYFTRRATGYPGPGIIPSDARSFYLTLSYQGGK